MLKMYIAVHDKVPDKMVPVIVAHASLKYYLSFSCYPVCSEWVKSSFKKVVVSLNDKEMSKISTFFNEASVPMDVVSESTVSELGDCCYVGVFGKTDEGFDAPLPNVLKYARLWSPDET